jgi:hypothetical protein
MDMLDSDLIGCAEVGAAPLSEELKRLWTV